MKSLIATAALAAGLTTCLALPQIAAAGEADYAAMVSAQAAANGVPEALVHRIIMRESRYQPHLVGRGGTIGLMQIKLATARGVGYTGDAAGLRDPNTNLTYAVKYLAGAYRAANGDHAKAIRYYAGGYYYAAKRQRQRCWRRPTRVRPSASPGSNPTAIPSRRSLRRRAASWPCACATRGRRFPFTSRHCGAMR
jgi:soluble lytic murein transglycosylase-like protein